MKLLCTVKSVVVNPSVADLDYSSFKPRNAARAVLFDGQKIYLIYVSAHDYYMLPGGGIEQENMEEGLRRELREEVGCEIDIIREVGKTILYFERWQTKQIDFCYIVNKKSSQKVLSRTEFEINEGHQIKWVNGIDSAISLLEKAEPYNNDGKIIKQRDVIFLKTAKSILK